MFLVEKVLDGGSILVLKWLLFIYGLLSSRVPTFLAAVGGCVVWVWVEIIRCTPHMLLSWICLVILRRLLLSAETFRHGDICLELWSLFNSVIHYWHVIRTPPNLIILLPFAIELEIGLAHGFLLHFLQWDLPFRWLVVRVEIREISLIEHFFLTLYLLVLILWYYIGTYKFSWCCSSLYHYLILLHRRQVFLTVVDSSPANRSLCLDPFIVINKIVQILFTTATLNLRLVLHWVDDYWFLTGDVVWTCRDNFMIWLFDHWDYWVWSCWSCPGVSAERLCRCTLRLLTVWQVGRDWTRVLDFVIRVLLLTRTGISNLALIPIWLRLIST